MRRFLRDTAQDTTFVPPTDGHERKLLSDEAAYFQLQVRGAGVRVRADVVAVMISEDGPSTQHTLGSTAHVSLVPSMLFGVCRARR